jgi:hypothetical protein
VETEATYQNAKGKVTKTSKEVIRPISKLARIPIEEDEQDPRFKALPYPNQLPAVKTIVRPQRLTRLPSWQWMYSIILIASTHLSGVAGSNWTNQSSRTKLDPFPYPLPWVTTVIIMLILFSIIGVIGNLCTIAAICRSID